ncbi:MAG: hypothetical protein HY711_07920, partial [Candidatus Melainabacteria bacterium]|nr:hypothetical protein [Candidatus Melainabacteria bacterium]
QGKAVARGNTLVLVIAVVTVLALVGFFAMNYGQLFGTQREATNAAEAAALAVAKDLGRVVINGNFGKVALVDDVDGNINNRTVIGINTILATIRLDTIVSKELGNKTMLLLCKQDLKKANDDAKQLKDAIMAACASTGAVKPVDKDNNPINIQENALAIYLANSRRMGKGQLVGKPTIEIGRLPDGEGMTNVPVPSPESAAQVDNSTSYSAASGKRYKPYTKVATNAFGQTLDFTFAAIGDQPSLVNNNKFTQLSSSDILPPSVVRITASESINSLAPNAGGKGMSGVVKVAATAQCGGSRLTGPSGSLCVSFPQGFPPDSPALKFNTVKDIMNASMLSETAQDKSTSPFTGWNNAGQGNWFVAKNGPVPGTAKKMGELVQAPYRGRSQDDPSVALSFMVYDWLKTMGLRANITSVVNALSEPLKTKTKGSEKAFTAYLNNFISPAYAETQNTLPAISALFNVDPTGQFDPRDQRRFATNPPAFREQLLNVWGYKPAQATIPDNARVIAFNENGNVVTTNGENTDVLDTLWVQVITLNRLASQTFENARTLASGKAQEALSILAEIENIQSEINSLIEAGEDPNSAKISELKQKVEQQMPILTALLQTLERADMIMFNAGYAMNVAMEMYKNQKALTGGSVKVIGTNHLKVMDTDFWPPTRAATKEEIAAEGPVDTGQEASAPVKDWAAPAKDGQVQLVFLKRTQYPVIGSRPTSDSWLPPALAETSIPPNQDLMFLFNVQGDTTNSSKPGGGNIHLSVVPTTPFAGLSLLDGQSLYQNLNSLVTQEANSNVQLVWHVMARNQNASNSATYFADTKAEGYSQSPAEWCYQSSYGNAVPTTLGQEKSTCPPLVAEWIIRCPMGLATRPPAGTPPPA